MDIKSLKGKNENFWKTFITHYEPDRLPRLKDFFDEIAGDINHDVVVFVVI